MTDWRSAIDAFVKTRPEGEDVTYTGVEERYFLGGWNAALAAVEERVTPYSVLSGSMGIGTVRDIIAALKEP